jgi:hypothetical protein
VKQLGRDSVVIAAHHEQMNGRPADGGFIPILIALIALDVFCLVELFRAEEVCNLPQVAVGHPHHRDAPVRAIGYLIFGGSATVVSQELA